MLVYVKTGAENNQVYPSVNLLGTVEGIEKFFFVEGAVNVSQQYLHAVRRAAAGPHQRDAEPLHVGDLSHFALHSRHDTGQLSVRNTQQQQLDQSKRRADRHQQFLHRRMDGQAVEPVGAVRMGPRLRLDQRQVHRPDSARSRSWPARPCATRRIHSFGSTRTADTRTTSTRSSTIAARSTAPAFQWNPTRANQRRRQLGAPVLRLVLSVHVRPPHAAFRHHCAGSRNTTSYPQQFLSIPADRQRSASAGFPAAVAHSGSGSSVSLRSTRSFRTGGCRQPDGSGQSLYAADLPAGKRERHVRHSRSARTTCFSRPSTPRPSRSRAPERRCRGFFSQGNNNTQTGASIAWTHNITTMVTLNATATYTHTVANAPLVGTTNQGYFLLGLTAPLSAKTTLYAGRPIPGCAFRR